MKTNLFKNTAAIAICFIFLPFINSAQNIWTQISNFPGGGQVGNFSFVVNGKAYVGGGYSPASQTTQELWQYDPATGNWVQKNDFPTTILSPVTFVISDTVYVTTGWTSTLGTAQTTTFRYNDFTDVWDSVASYPGTPGYTGACFVINDKAYVGIAYTPYTNELWEYDPMNDSWAQKADCPGHDRQSTVSFAINGKGYVGLGAYEPTLSSYADFYEYDPVLDTWDSIGIFPGATRYASSVFVLNNKAYIGLGYDYSNYYNNLWEFDPFNYSWTQVNDFGGLERHASTCFVIGNEAYIGIGRSGVYYNDFWKYTPSLSNEIQGYTYSDDNNNQIFDSTENAFKNLLVEVNPGNAIFSSNSSGWYRALADTGNYTVTLPNPPLYYTPNPLSHSISFSQINVIDSSGSFALAPTPNVDDLQIILTPVINPRPGFNHYYNITYKNLGTTTVASGTIQMITDSSLTFIATVPADTSVVISNDTITWSYLNLEPAESRVFMIWVNVATWVGLGDTVSASACIYPQLNDVDITNNCETQSQESVGSFDPNDKQVSPEGDITIIQVSNGEWLTYTIRFQNTGTAPAENIRVADTVSLNLNLASLEMLTASHNYLLTLDGDRTLKWFFPNIMLPDSNSNEPLSHGFIKFRIKPESTLIVGELIENYAAIYFDFNVPVLTNTTVTNIINPTGVLLNNQQSQDFKIVPNPNNGTFKIEFVSSKYNEASFEMYNSVGQIIINQKIEIREGKNRILVNERKLNQGIYFLKFKAIEKVLTKKIIIY